MKSGRAQYWYRLLLIAFFLLPIAYFALILSVAIHEVLGHGVAALWLGGEFTGFVLKWDGMGWALAFPHPNAVPSHQIVILAAGVGADAACGVLFLLVALLVRSRLFSRLALLVLASTSLVDGTSYLFWNAYHPVPPGDIGQILALTDSSFLRPLALVLGGAMMIASTIPLNALIFQGAEEWLGQGRRLHGVRKAIALAALIAIPGAAGWFIFDWNQLAPGIGLFPCVVGAVLEVATAIGLYWYSVTIKGPARRLGEAWKPVLLAWAVTGITSTAMCLWLSQGVHWA